MRHYRKALIAILLVFLTSPMVWGKNGANSPLTRYGFGQLADQSLSGNKAMGGVGIGWRSSIQINAINPASYTAVDSLSFLFDVGFSLQNTNFSDGKTKLNAKNSSMTLGFLPYSNVGYSFSSTEKLPAQTEWDDPVTVSHSYNGTGGLHQAFIGVGYELLPNLSIGTNVSYLFGNFSHKVSATFSDGNSYPLARNYYAEISDIKFDFGTQYTLALNKKNLLTAGATYSLGKDLHATDSYISQQKLNGSVVITDSVTHVKDAFQLPHSFGVGITYEYDERITVGADFLLQKFGETRFFGKQGELADRAKYSAGVQYYPDPESNNFFKQMKYRFGAYYSKPYVKVDGQEAAHEYGIGVGITFPVSKWGWRTQRSIFNISGEWVKIDPKVKGVLTENYLRLNIGMTFNERWFNKQKVR